MRSVIPLDHFDVVEWAAERSSEHAVRAAPSAGIRRWHRLKAMSLCHLRMIRGPVSSSAAEMRSVTVARRNVLAR